jgi:predicted DNA-binding ribbon-helix-helix protein
MAILVTKVIALNGRNTSMRLVTDEWEALELICERENVKRNHLIELIDDNKNSVMALTSSVRLFITAYFYQLQKEKETPYYSSFRQENKSPIFHAIKSIL